MSVIVRSAVPGDAAGLAPLLEQLGYPGTEAFVERRVEQMLRHPDALLLVAEGDGELLGVVSVHFIPQLALAGDFCRISYLCVAVQARGHGIGALLEDAVEQAARQRGCDRIELHCNEHRVDAHRFYDRLGYTESPKYLLKPMD